ncbi:hypothetical protein Lal_00040065 [Lupinus albus]|nr:hypothetical protein Lal_00040065 [Lupinus albus]
MFCNNRFDFGKKSSLWVMYMPLDKSYGNPLNMVCYNLRTDPFNPVHIMSFSGARESISRLHQLVGMRGLCRIHKEQMIDLPIQAIYNIIFVTERVKELWILRLRTSDAGYLTRRLVEVVQHIVIRYHSRHFCDYPGWNDDGKFLIQTLIGRVLADNIYIGLRCIAIRNQDIGIGLLNRFIIFQTQPISIRTPFTCSNTSWICRLCYGRSPLMEPGGIGRSCRYYCGSIYWRTRYSTNIKNFSYRWSIYRGTAEHDGVHPTRTHHGHPAFLCYIDLYVTIVNDDIIYNIVTIPPKSFLLVQNDQYVESEQVIAEIRARTYTLNFKEKIQKHIYSDSEGEMHWSTNVYHACKFTYSNVWCRLVSLRKDQDQMNIDSFASGKEKIQIHKFFSSNPYGKKQILIPDLLGFNQIICMDHFYFLHPNISPHSSDLLAKR